MAFTVNGIGAHYYGTRWLLDGTYLTTKWLVFAFVPIVPLGSVRVLSASHPYGAVAYTGQSLAVEHAPLDIWMVLRIYVIELAVAAVLCLVEKLV